MDKPTNARRGLILLRGTRAVIDPQHGVDVQTWQAFQQSVKSDGARRLRHSTGRVELRVASVDRVHRPFATRAILRYVGGRQGHIIDDSGQTQRVTLRSVVAAGCRAACDLASTRALLRRTYRELDRIDAQLADRVPPRFDPARRPLYLRTDLTFGLTSGGSVGHVAGVLNALPAFSAPPLWLTTDTLPTVRDDIEHVLLDPGRRHWEHVERIALAANHAYAPQLGRVIGSIDAGCVYQRYSLNNYTALRLAADHGLPLVTEFNGSEPWIARQWGGGPLRYEPIAQRIEAMNLRYADLVVVVSEPMRATAVELGARAEHVLVNPNGVDTDRYHPGVDGAAVRRKLGLEDKIVIGFIGTFDRWHGAPVLVDAMDRLLRDRPTRRATLACVMIGDGPEWATVQRRVGALGLDDVVHLTGRVAQADGPGYLAACDVLASPHVPNADGSAFFGSPTKLFEYLAMGRAVVASRLGQLGEVLAHEESALLVEPGDAAALADAIGRLVDDAALRERLGAAGRAQAERQHTWHRHTQRIVDRLAAVPKP